MRPWLGAHCFLLTPIVVAEQCGSFNDFIRNTAAECVREIEDKPRGEMTRIERRKSLAVWKAIAKDPAALARHWNGPALDYAWTPIERVLNRRAKDHVRVQVWELRAGSLCPSLSAESVGGERVINVLRWNANVAPHYDLLLAT